MVIGILLLWHAYHSAQKESQQSRQTYDFRSIFTNPQNQRTNPGLAGTGRHSQRLGMNPSTFNVRPALTEIPLEETRKFILLFI
jgi:hypothetical protein